MNIYLDVDGVLISGGEPVKHLEDFIAYLDANHSNDVYWLTTHCQGSTDDVMAYMRRFIGNESTLTAMAKFKPTRWNVAKTEAIDVMQPFLWFDDNLLYAEKLVLSQANKVDNMILVNLKNNPDSLQMYTRDFPIPV